MGYKRATPEEVIGEISEYHLTDYGRGVGMDRIREFAGEGILVVVDAFDVHLAKTDDFDGKWAKVRLEQNGIQDPSEWVLLANVFHDETYFDEEDRKWEFCSTDWGVLAPKSRVS